MCKRWLVYILILIITALLSVAYLESAPTVLLCVEFMFLMLSFLYDIFSLPGVCVYPDTREETKTAGDELRLVARIKNRSVLPVFYGELLVELKFKQSDEVVLLRLPFTSMPGRPQEMIYHFRADYSGELIISYKCIYVYDFLRLFRLKKGIKAKKRTVSIAPRLQKMPVNDRSSRFQTSVAYEHAAGEDSEVRVQQFYKDRVGDDPSEVFDTHAYRIGDQLSRVNWKLSARAGELMVKDYSFPIVEKTVVLVDLSCESQKEFHQRVHTAMTICFSVLEADMCVALAWADSTNNACQIRRFEKDEDLFEGIGELIGAGISVKRSPEELVGEMGLPNEMEQLIYVTSKPDDEEMGELSRIDESRRVYIFAIGESEMSTMKLTDKLTFFALPSEGLEDALSQTLLEVY